MATTEALLNAFTTLLVTTDPPGLAPIFLGLTVGMTAAQRRQTALRGIVIAFGILAVFALTGASVLSLLGISLPAFRIAGGLLLLLSTFFLLRDGDEIWRWVLGLLPAATRPRLDQVGRVGWHTLGGYMRGVTIIAALHGTSVFVVLLILEVPMAAALAVLIFILAAAAQHELLTELVGQLILTSLDSLFRHVDGPFVVLDLGGRIDDLSIGSDATSKLVVAAGIDLFILVAFLVGAVLGIVVATA